MWLPITGCGPGLAELSVHVDGTRNLLEAARKQGVERVVYTSTVVVSGAAGRFGDENQQVKLEEMSAYKRSKFWRKSSSGICGKRTAGGDCESTAPVGDHDVKPTPTGKIILIS
jgi:dihydroflavonol-4-reductase